MRRLHNFENDLKKISGIRSLENDISIAEQKIDQMDDLELIQLTKSRRLVRVGEFLKPNHKTYVIYKLRHATSNPKNSSRDGLRIWFCADDHGEKTLCLVQRSDKKKQSQIETLNTVKQRIKNEK